MADVNKRAFAKEMFGRAKACVISLQETKLNSMLAKKKKFFFFGGGGGGGVMVFGSIWVR